MLEVLLLDPVWTGNVKIFVTYCVTNSLAERIILAMPCPPVCN